MQVLLWLTIAHLGKHYGAVECPTLDHIHTEVPSRRQASAVLSLIDRLLPHRSNEFKVTVDEALGSRYRTTFKLVSTDGLLHVTGNTGVAAAWGFYYYLTQYCDCHISWAGDQVTLPTPLPAVPQPGVQVTSNDRFRYYQNVCTVSYSFVWWSWERWQREIDWMAMNGINLPLAFNAQESIWQKVYLKMGFTQAELDSHFGGPAFLAWSRMGNIHGWGGPLTQSWHRQQIDLQHKILHRMREFGMTPVLPAFAGHVPASIVQHYRNVTVSKLPCWSHFNNTFSGTYLLDVNDPLFSVIGKSFINEYTAEFGTDHVYNADTFNEMTPKSSDPGYLGEAGRAVYDAMVQGDPRAIWLMQGWLFTDTAFWKKPQAKALLTSVPMGKMIVLDLFSEVMPFYDKFDSYYGQPFIWCMLHNFGGTLPMYGVVDSVNQGPFKARSFLNSSMIGIGLTPEGINQNNVIYEFMLENSWRQQPRSISTWASNYAVRRYGQRNDFTEKAWQIFMTTVYNCTDGTKHHNKNTIVRRPSRRLVESAGVYNCTSGYIDHGYFDVIFVTKPSIQPMISQQVWYDAEEFFQAWDMMVEASHSIRANELFRYDLVDVTRQALQLMAIPYYTGLIAAYKQRQIQAFRSSGAALLELLSDMDAILATDAHFLLGAWLQQAKSQAPSPAESALYEYNARVQVTTWGPHAEILDYANKQWAGLVGSYYRPRWQLFISQLDKSLTQGLRFNQSQFDQDVFTAVEQPFTFRTNLYPDKPTGDQIAASQAVHKKYRPHTIMYRKLFRNLPEWTRRRTKFLRRASQSMRKYDNYLKPVNNEVIKYFVSG